MSIYSRIRKSIFSPIFGIVFCISNFFILFIFIKYKYSEFISETTINLPKASIEDEKVKSNEINTLKDIKDIKTPSHPKFTEKNLLETRKETGIKNQPLIREQEESRRLAHIRQQEKNARLARIREQEESRRLAHIREQEENERLARIRAQEESERFARTRVEEEKQINKPSIDQFDSPWESSEIKSNSQQLEDIIP